MQLRVRTIAIVIILTVGICVPVAAENAPAVVPPPKSCTALATTGSDAVDSAEKDADLQFRLELPWENYLIPAPTAIFLLAQLTVLSGAGDFAMTSLMNGKAQFVRYPESFSASLVQVSNEGWSAFNTAHRNMDSIQMYTYQIPRTVNNALRVIATAPISMPSATRNKFLRVHLSSMVDYSKQCVALAQATELKAIHTVSPLGWAARPPSGKHLADQLLNRTFNLQIGPAHMLAGCQIENHHVASTFNFLRGSFLPYFAFIANPSDDRFLWVRLSNTAWFDGDSLPPNEPLCGFDGLRNSEGCSVKGDSKLNWALGLGAAFGICLAIFTGTVLWRRELAKSNDAWNLDPSRLFFPNSVAASRRRNVMFGWQSGWNQTYVVFRPACVNVQSRDL